MRVCKEIPGREPQGLENLMAEDRSTRLSQQLVKRIRRDTDLGGQFSTLAEEGATLERIRWREIGDVAWVLKVPLRDGSTMEFHSKWPASDLVRGKIKGYRSGWREACVLLPIDQ